MDIILKKDKGFKWFSDKSVFIKGYFFDKNDVFYQQEQVLKFFKNIKKTELKEKLKTLNGVFTVIIKYKEETILYADTTRIFPLFYTFKDDTFLISDDVSEIKTSNNINPIAATEFLNSLHTYGNKTLLKDVFQLQSNEFLVLGKNGKIKSEFLFSYAVTKTFDEDYDRLKNKAKDVIESAFSRLIKSLDNKPVVVPLSAGFDSRLIVAQLKKHQYKNVTCYTYGKKSSFEIEKSKKVAQQLGFKWIFIEYDKKLIEKYSNTNNFKNYIDFAANYASTPNFQEFFAVNYLKENKLIDENAIFISGYAGDLLGGSQFLKVIPENLTPQEIPNLILKEKLNLTPLTTEKQNVLLKEIEKKLNNIAINYQDKLATSVFEDVDLKEKITKYIFNSANFYTFFDFEIRFPFWDLALLNFFKKVPISFKIHKKLFDDVLIESYFKPQNVFFENEFFLKNSNLERKNIKDKIKPFLPNIIKQKLLQKSDWVNYYEITNHFKKELMKNNIKLPKEIKSYNLIVAIWYLNYIKGNLKK